MAKHFLDIYYMVGQWVRITENPLQWFKVKLVYTDGNNITWICVERQNGYVYECTAGDIVETRTDNPWTA